MGSISSGSQRRKYRTGDAETRRLEEGKIPAGENEHLPPLASAYPRLLFDFLPALMSPNVDDFKTGIKLTEFGLHTGLVANDAHQQSAVSATSLFLRAHDSC